MALHKDTHLYKTTYELTLLVSNCVKNMKREFKFDLGGRLRSDCFQLCRLIYIANWSRDSVHSIDEPLRTMTVWPRGGSQSVVSPSIVPATHQGADRVHDVRGQIPTITAAHRGELMLSSPVMVQASHGEGKPGGVKRWGLGAKDAAAPVGAMTASGRDHSMATAMLVGVGGRNGQSEPRTGDDTFPTMTAKPDTAVVTAYLAQMNGGFNEIPGRAATDPISTIANSASQQQLVAAHLTALSENVTGSDLREPMQTVMAGATRYGLVEYDLAPEDEEGALRVAAFLIRYYGLGGQLGDLRDPMHTLTTKDRLALVTVYVKGMPYVVVDIRLRMLRPPELYRGQGFPDNYIIERGADGRKFSISAQGRMCGNSVSPPPGYALVAANLPPEERWRMAA